MHETPEGDAFAPPTHQPHSQRVFERTDGSTFLTSRVKQTKTMLFE